MGMYDEVECAADLPGKFLIAGRRFQTKSLYRGLDRFTISKNGRLIFNACRYEPSKEPAWIPLMTRILTEDIDLEFHGDIWLITDEGELQEYVARFTHGTLEWVRRLPLSDLPEPQRMLLVRKCLQEE